MNALLLVLFLSATEQPGAHLGDLTWPEAEERMATAPAVILPFGAGAKEHGAHLPMNADQVVMEHLVEQAVTKLAVVAAPPILHGWFPAFRDFPGTEVEDAAVFREYVFLVAKSLVRSGARRIVFLNTGITNATGLPIAIAAREIRAQCKVPTLVVSWNDLETEAASALAEQPWGGHADEIETSINLALQPDRVQMDKAGTDLGNPPKDYPGYRPGGFSRDPDNPLYSESGIYGDPSKATAEKGRKVLAIMSERWLEALEGFSREPTGPVSPACRAPFKATAD